MDLYNPLIFCNDSILRMKNYHNDKVILYPFIDIQHFLKEDPIVILKLFRQPVSLEQGTTLANIILALEPWAKITILIEMFKLTVMLVGSLEALNKSSHLLKYLRACIIIVIITIYQEKKVKDFLNG